jgi:hypothetical protein
MSAVLYAKMEIRFAVAVLCGCVPVWTLEGADTTGVAPRTWKQPEGWWGTVRIEACDDRRDRR